MTIKNDQVDVFAVHSVEISGQARLYLRGEINIE
jgi:hypothetical protein